MSFDVFCCFTVFLCFVMCFLRVCMIAISFDVLCFLRFFKVFGCIKKHKTGGHAAAPHGLSGDSQPSPRRSDADPSATAWQPDGGRTATATAMATATATTTTTMAATTTVFLALCIYSCSSKTRQHRCLIAQRACLKHVFL